MDSLELSGSQPRLNSPSIPGFHLSLGVSLARHEAIGTSLFSISHMVTASGPAAAKSEPSGENAVLKACVPSVVGRYLTHLNGSSAFQMRVAPDMELVASKTEGRAEPLVR